MAPRRRREYEPSKKAVGARWRAAVVARLPPLRRGASEAHAALKLTLKALTLKALALMLKAHAAKASKHTEDATAAAAHAKPPTPSRPPPPRWPRWPRWPPRRPRLLRGPMVSIRHTGGPMRSRTTAASSRSMHPFVRHSPQHPRPPQSRSPPPRSPLPRPVPPRPPRSPRPHASARHHAPARCDHRCPRTGM